MLHDKLKEAGRRMFTEQALAMGRNRGSVLVAAPDSSFLAPPNKRLKSSPAAASAATSEECAVTKKYQIEVTEVGTLPPAEFVQKWANKGVIPDGSRGKFVCFGEVWHFSIDYGECVMCADGVKRHLLAFGIRNQAWHEPFVLLENERDCMQRDRQGFTICGKTFTKALHLRAAEFAVLRDRETDAGEIAKWRSKIAQFSPHRFPEGPVLFGLRDRAAQRELRKPELL
ncbi:hypothetical protein BASA81_003328 [Batrachochytrium salamandrivorans]|nr:hypothetical protein BASA81_003328 [Batrachochytrium salamandrivorans]